MLVSISFEEYFFNCLILTFTGNIEWSLTGTLVPGCWYQVIQILLTLCIIFDILSLNELIIFSYIVHITFKQNHQNKLYLGTLCFLIVILIGNSLSQYCVYVFFFHLILNRLLHGILSANDILLS